MTNIIQLDETIEVQRPLHEVFAYISEFSRIEEWDPAVARGERTTEGPLGVGTQFRIDMKAGFSLHYTVVEWEPNRRLLMTVDSRPFKAREEIFFNRNADGTRVRYVATFDFVAPLAALAKLFPGFMDRVGKSAMAGMKRALEDRFDPPRSDWGTVLADKLVVPGMLGFTRFGHRLARNHWNPVSAYLRDRHIVITGATSGLGLATAQVLAARGAELTLVARDAGKAKRVAQDLRRRFGNRRIHVELAELSLLEEVRALAARLLKRGKPIEFLRRPGCSRADTCLRIGPLRRRAPRRDRDCGPPADCPRPRSTRCRPCTARRRPPACRPRGWHRRTGRPIWRRLRSSSACLPVCS
jgi:uncharacterized protein YndB with AHSA1/START domain